LNENVTPKGDAIFDIEERPGVPARHHPEGLNGNRDGLYRIRPKPNSM
jgi:hypothetical protein